MVQENEQDVVLGAAAEAIAEQDEESSIVWKNGDHMEMSNGVVLQVKAVNPLIINVASTKVPEPEVPTVFIESENKHIPNPVDPAYVAAMRKYRQDQNEAIVDAGMLMGTEIVSIPEGMYPPENDEWMERLEFLGIINRDQITQNRFTRYLGWIKYYGIGDDVDYQRVSNVIMRLTGVPESEVSKTLATFPNRAQRRANRNGRS